jgi:ABC-type transport system involved in multi-copper enzyme maturation permease subunit
MKSLMVTFWAESLKVRKSKVLWITMVFFAFIACMMGLIIFLQQHPELSQKLGLIGMKANMLRFGQPSWENYLVLLSQGMAGIGLIGFGFITSWVFGREYTDHTIKDILTLPASRSSFVISKLLVIMIWGILLSAIFMASGLLFGRIAGISGWSGQLFTSFLYKFTMVSLLSLLLSTPIAFFASSSNGFLLPIGIVILTMMMANFTGLVGVGPYFPWAIPSLFAVPSGKPIEIQTVSYLILFGTSMIGLAGTLAWWRFADQK